AGLSLSCLGRRQDTDAAACRSWPANVNAAALMYRIAPSGTEKAICMEPDQSATNPIRGGIKAPPTIDVTINPDTALACSGIRSTTIEKINGNMLAKPNPTRKKLAVATVRLGTSTPKMPRIESEHVMGKNLDALIQFRITPPEKRPMVRARKNSPVPRSPTRVISSPKRSFKYRAIPELTETSAPTCRNIANTKAATYPFLSSANADPKVAGS